MFKTHRRFKRIARWRRLVGSDGRDYHSDSRKMEWAKSPLHAGGFALHAAAARAEKGRHHTRRPHGVIHPHCRVHSFLWNPFPELSHQLKKINSTAFNQLKNVMPMFAGITSLLFVARCAGAPSCLSFSFLSSSTPVVMPRAGRIRCFGYSAVKTQDDGAGRLGARSGLPHREGRRHGFRSGRCWKRRTCSRSNC